MVFELPMRDGNAQYSLLSGCSAKVFELPMRDGNRKMYLMIGILLKFLNFL